MKTTNLLMDEHKHILLALYILEQMAQLTERREPVEAQDIEDILCFLKAFADEHHQGREEAFLFPALLKASRPVQKNVLEQMIFEHDQERSLVQGLQDALHTRKGSEFVECAERLIQILRSHIFKEDHILFELAEQVLSDQQDSDAERDLKEYDRVWQETALCGLLKNLHRMERKYLGRTVEPQRHNYA